MANNLRKLREDRGLTRPQLAKMAGTTAGQITKLERGERQLTQKWLERLSKSLKCRKSEILSDDEGLHLSNSGGEAPTNEPFHLEVTPVLEIDAVAGMGLGGEAETVIVSNGSGTQHEHLVLAQWSIPSNYLAAELRVPATQARIIAVDGDSMAPTLMSGDRVMIDLRRRAPSPDGIYALWDGLGVVVKRLERIPNADPPQVKIISDNPHHTTYERSAEEVNIIGRVIWYARRI